ncbi:MAG: signal recognition particle-docking protein FtsY [Candidatus Heimdallarchaeota archaeon]
MPPSLKKGFQGLFERFTTAELTEKNLEKPLDEIRLLLIRNDTAAEVAAEIAANVGKLMIGQRAKRFSNKVKLLQVALRRALIHQLTPTSQINILEMIKKRTKESSSETNPLVILFLGVNGTGKTTTVAKLAHAIKKAKYRMVLASADTFRSGAQEQLKTHAERLKVSIIQGQYHADAAAVAFDAVAHAKARHGHAVLIDTAGRMEENYDLLREMDKIKRVTSPDLTILVADALAGNAAVAQARNFHEQVGIDGVILTKMDADARGGAALSITHVTDGKPICYIGIGQEYRDLEPFNSEKFVKHLLS